MVYVKGAAKILFDRDSDNSEFLVAELEKFLSLSWEEQVKARKLAGEKKLNLSAKRNFKKF